jgi:hypothetical protein
MCIYMSLGGALLCAPSDIVYFPPFKKRKICANMSRNSCPDVEDICLAPHCCSVLLLSGGVLNPKNIASTFEAY